jgi:phospholipid-translocating ATPase
VRGAFTRGFGRSPTWWLAAIVALSAVMAMELVASAIRRVYFPQDEDLVQEMERDGSQRTAGRPEDAEEGNARRGGAEEQQQQQQHSAHTSMSAELEGFRFDGASPTSDRHRHHDLVKPPPPPPSPRKESSRTLVEYAADGGRVDRQPSSAAPDRRWNGGNESREYVESPIEMQPQRRKEDRRWG